MSHAPPAACRAEELRILRGEQEVDEAALRLGDLDDDDEDDDGDDISQPSDDQVSEHCNRPSQSCGVIDQQEHLPFEQTAVAPYVCISCVFRRT
jgi:hypothetical protein